MPRRLLTLGSLAIALTFAVPSCGDRTGRTQQTASLPPAIPDLPTAPVGQLPGQLEITPEGAARYQIPIEVPPGRAGIEPNLSVTYQSSGGDGPMGAGFSLNGLSAISRCGSSYAQDDRLAAVALDDSDHFCLSGARLVAVDGDYGADGTEYRTELDTRRKIVGHAAADGTVVGFTVYERSGRTATYGAQDTCSGSSTDETCSSVRVAAGGIPVAWTLRRVEDRFGNFMTVTYLRRVGEDDETVEQLPSRIDYTGHAPSGLAPTRRVELVYQKRPDPSVGYRAGTRFEQTLRLDEIRTRADEIGPVRRYNFDYEEHGHREQSHIVAISVCDSHGDCKPPTRFEWDYPSAELQSDIVAPVTIDSWDSQGYTYQPPLAADIDFDGRADLLFQKQERWSTARATGDGQAFESPVHSGFVAFFGPSPWHPDYGDDDEMHDYRRRGRAVRTEVGADGRADLLLPNRGQLLRTGLNGQGEPTVVDRQVLVSPSELYPDMTDMEFFPDVARLADLDGNGTPDYLYCYWDSDNVAQWRVHLHDGSGFGEALPIDDSDDLTCAPWKKLSVVDVDGDGANELLTTKYGYDILSGLPGQVTTREAGIPSQEDPLLIVDVNGDGLRDVIGDDGRIWLSNGRSFVGGPNGFAGFAAGDEPDALALREARVMDLDLDGRSDLLLPRETDDGGAWTVYRSTGELSEGGGLAFARGPDLLTYTDIDAAGPPGIYRTGLRQAPLFADVDGDLAPDFLYRDDYGKLRVRRHLGPPRLLIRRIREGSSGAEPGSQVWPQRWTHAIDYEPLHTPGLYEATLPDGSSPPRCEQSESCSRPSMLVVAQHHVNGGSDTRTFTYRYHASRSDRLGRGWLGFAARVIEEKQYQTRIIEEYDNYTAILGTGRKRIYPFARRRIRRSVEIEDGGVLHVRESRTELALQEPAAGTWRVYTQSQSWRRLESGTQIDSWERRVDAIDPYGNALEVTVTLGDDERIDLMTASYHNDPASWLIGLVTRRDHTSTVGNHTQTRSVAYDYAPETGALERETLDPDSPERQSWTTIKDRDVYGNPIAINVGSPENADRTTELEYDEQGLYVSRTIDPLGHEVRVEHYPATGAPWIERDANGHVTRWRYDRLGRLAAIDRPGEADVFVERVRVDEAGGGFHAEVTESTSAGAEQTTIYDWRDLPVSTTNASFGGGRSVIALEFDPRGLPISVSRPAWTGDQPAGHTTQQYDNLQRPTVQIDAAGEKTRVLYEGRRTTVIDRRGHQSVRERNGLGLLARSVDAKGSITVYEYGAFAELREIHADTQNASLDIATRRVTDPWGRLLELHDPDVGQWTFAYDPLGQRIREVDGKGTVTEYQHDLLGRVTARIDPDGITELQYDAASASDSHNRAGRLRATVSPDGIKTAYGYRPSGTVAWESVSVPGQGRFVRESSFDADGRLTEDRFAWPLDGGERSMRLAYDYDAFGWLRRVRDADVGETIWKLASVTPAGQVDLVTFGNGLRGARTYQATTGRLLRNRILGRLPVLDLSFQYDENGNLLRRTDNLASRWQELAYDELDRITGAVNCAVPRGGNKSCESEGPYQYDAIGNLRQKPGVGAYGYLNERPHTVKSVAGGSYEHDANGNQVLRPDAAVEYNALDRIRLWKGFDGTEASMAYAATGERIVKTVAEGGTATTTVSFGAMERIAPEDAPDKGTDRLYVYAYGRPVAAISIASKTRRVRYIHTDHLGSPALVTDEKGGETGRFFFDPFGQPRKLDWGGPEVKLGPSGITRGFTGHVHDEELGLINMVGRDYDPRLGRFITADPIVQAPGYSQSLNRYSYAWNSPTRLTDPTGFMTAEECAADSHCSLVQASRSGSAPSEQPAAPEPAPADAGGLGGTGTGIFDHAGWAPVVEDPTGGSDAGLDSDSEGSDDGMATRVVGVVVDAIDPTASFRDFDEDNEAMYRAIEEGDTTAAVAYGALSLLDAASAIADGLSLGTSSFGTKALRKGARAGVKKLLRMGKRKARRTTKCFVAGTLVHTIDGPKPIEEIRLGDLVLARDPETREQGYKEVVWLKPPTPSAIIEIALVDETGATEKIGTTAEHPFFVRSRGWVTAVDLSVGDEIFSSRGGWLRVTSGTWLASEQVVFNFEVADYHTYFVGRLGAFVHNACTKGGRKIPNEELQAAPAKRGNAPTGNDGHPVELHHRDQSPDGPLDEMTRTDHRGPGNFKRNHQNTGQEPSKIDRKKWKKEQKDYWKREWDAGRFDDMR